MKDSSAHSTVGPFRRFVAVAALALFVGAGLGACNGGDNDAPDETGATTTDAPRSGSVITTTPSGAPTSVEVTISEFEVRMPTILKPGPHLFNVTNVGTEEHGLTVEGNASSVALQANVQPGQKGSLPVDLAPGTYKVFCPVNGHADRGMSVEITVSE